MTLRARPHPPTRRRRRQRGVALVLVLTALTILAVMLTEFQDESSAELSGALAERDAVRAEYAAKSGIALARLLIAAEPTIRNRMAILLALMGGGGAAQVPVWKFADQVLGAFNDASGMESFQGLSGLSTAEGKNLGMQGAGFTLNIVDEDSKININAPARGSLIPSVDLGRALMALMASPEYDVMFENRDRDGQFSDRATICSAIIDYTDPNQDAFACEQDNAAAQQAAAEDSFYEMLKRPRSRKNAALDSLEELHLVRGVSDDFWATFVEPDPDDPDKRVLTVWGGEKLNVNQAPPQALLAVACGYAVPGQPLCIDPVQQVAWLGLLGILKSFTMGAPIFPTAGVFVDFLQGKGMYGKMIFGEAGAGGGIASLMGLELQPLILTSARELKDKVGVESKIFSIFSTGRVKSGKRETHVRIHAVVDFRDAPPPGMPRNVEDLQLPGTTTTSGTGGSGSTAPDPNSLQGYLEKSPAGNVIYYRVD